MKIGKNNARLYIQGTGDPSCYPKFRQLIELISSMEVPFAIGYTTGKGFNDPSIGPFLVEQGLSMAIFSIFSVEPLLLQKYMHDLYPEATLSILEYLCGEIKIYPNVIVVPGVNDGDHLYKTCDWLEDNGAKGLILFRFANYEQQGLIRGNAPLIEGQRVHSVEEFNEIVSELREKYKMRIDSMPLWDSIAKSPFCTSNRIDYLNQLPTISRNASVISGSIAAPYIQHILQNRGAKKAMVIATNKDITCLITLKDLKNLDLSLLEETVILPGRALVHDKEAQSVLSLDGIKRNIIRGPDFLTPDQMYWDTSRQEALEIEVVKFTELIRIINTYGA
jgi:methanogenesis marker radical SAM protein